MAQSEIRMRLYSGENHIQVGCECTPDRTEIMDVIDKEFKLAGIRFYHLQCPRCAHKVSISIEKEGVDAKIGETVSGTLGVVD